MCSGRPVDVVDPVDLLGIGLDVGQVQVDDDWLLTAPYDYARQRLVRVGVDLLVGRERRDVDEVAGARFGHELKPLAPPHPRAAGYHVDDTLQRTVMMRAGLGGRVDYDCPGPELLGAGPSGGDRRGAVHARRLRRVHIEFVGVHNPNPAQPPVSVGPLDAHRRLLDRDDCLTIGSCLVLSPARPARSTTKHTAPGRSLSLAWSGDGRSWAGR